MRHRSTAACLAIVLALATAGCGPSDEEVLAEEMPRLHAAVVDLIDRVRTWEDVEVWTQHRRIADEVVTSLAPAARGPVERIAGLGEGVEDPDALDPIIARTPLPADGGPEAAALTRALAGNAIGSAAGRLVQRVEEEVAAAFVPAIDANEPLRARLERFDAETFPSSTPPTPRSVADLTYADPLLGWLAVQIELMVHRLASPDAG